MHAKEEAYTKWKIDHLLLKLPYVHKLIKTSFKFKINVDISIIFPHVIYEHLQMDMKTEVGAYS